MKWRFVVVVGLVVGVLAVGRPASAGADGATRQTKSLGFVGDEKHTPSRSHGGPWNAPDNVLPPHRHSAGTGATVVYVGGRRRVAHRRHHHHRHHHAHSHRRR